MKMTLLAAMSAALLAAAPASAASYVFDLTGVVSSGSSATVDSGGFRFNFFTIALSDFTPTVFEAGDTIEAMVTFDEALIVPSAGVRNGVDLVFLNTAFPGTTTETSGTTDLFLMGAPVLDQASGSTSSDALFNGLTNFSGTSFAFDSAQSNFSVVALGAPTLPADVAYFRWYTADALPAVPEPASWAMMILGFGLVGAAMRKRKANVAYA